MSKTINYYAMRESADGDKVEILWVTRIMDAPGRCREMTEEVTATFPNTPSGLRAADAKMSNANRGLCFA